MAVTITRTIQSNQLASDMTDSICLEFGYNAATDGTKASFVNKQIDAWFLGIHRRQLSAAAIKTANTNVETIINGIIIT